MSLKAMRQWHVRSSAARNRGVVFMLAAVLGGLAGLVNAQTPNPLNNPFRDDPQAVRTIPSFTVLPAERNTGTKTAGLTPSCVSSNQGLECFARSMAASPSLITATFAGGRWSTWTSLGGSIKSDPSCFNPGPGRPTGPDNISCIAVGLNDGFWLLKRANGQWNTDWRGMRFGRVGSHVAAPDGVTCIDAQYCYARQANTNQLLRARFSPEGWTAWYPEHDGTISSKPNCFVDHQGTESWETCYARGSAQVVRWRSNGRSGPEWATYDGYVASPPSCIRTGDAQAMCAARRGDGLLVYRILPPVGMIGASPPAPAPWRAVTGRTIKSPPSCVTQTTCFAIGNDQKLWRFGLKFDGSTPTAEPVSGTVSLRDHVTCTLAGNIHCFAVSVQTRELMHYEIAP